MDSNLAQKISRESSERLWFVARASVLKGPFTTEQLKDKVARREISFLDFCWRHGFNEWRPLGSVEDFDRRSRFKRLPMYPQVEVPASAAGGMYLRDMMPPEAELIAPPKNAFKSTYTPKRNISNKAPRFEVSFAKQKRHSISIYEWGLAAVFAVVLSYFAADYTMKQLAHSVSTHLAYLNSGVEEVRGDEVGAAIHPETWAPLFSAPEFNEVFWKAHEERLGLPELMVMNVELRGRPKQVANEGWILTQGLEQYPLDFSSVPTLWKASDEGLDPIFRRPLRIKGQLRPSHAQLIKVHLLGDPRSP